MYNAASDCSTFTSVHGNSNPAAQANSSSSSGGGGGAGGMYVAQLQDVGVNNVTGARPSRPPSDAAASGVYRPSSYGHRALPAAAPKTGLYLTVCSVVRVWL